MRRLKIAARALAVLALLAGAAMPAGAETLLARGTYLVENIAGCGNCHTPQGPKGPIVSKAYAGGLKIEAPGQFTVFTTNITQDKQTGIGNWTVAQIMTAVREGRRPDGSVIRPPMPFGLYRGLSDRDALAIASYVKTFKAVSNRVPKSVYKIPTPKSWGPPVKNVKAPPRSNKTAYGAYLAGPMGHCIECHTPFAKNGVPDFKNRLGAGGNAFHGPWGVSAATNITPHKTDGIGAWTDAEIKRAITKGVSRDGRKLKPPMGFAYYARMSAANLDALVAYLRSLKARPTE